MPSNASRAAVPCIRPLFGSTMALIAAIAALSWCVTGWFSTHESNIATFIFFLSFDFLLLTAVARQSPQVYEFIVQGWF
jgi:hypothetical protein